MGRRRSKHGYDSMCYYAGKLIGRCSVADGNAFCVLMEECDGDANKVLQTFAYFSPELKGILMKISDIQKKRKKEKGVNRK